MTDERCREAMSVQGTRPFTAPCMRVGPHHEHRTWLYVPDDRAVADVRWSGE